MKPLRRTRQDDSGSVGVGSASSLDSVEGAEEREGDVEEEGDLFQASVVVEKGGEEIHDAQVGISLLESDAHRGVGGEADVCVEGKGIGRVGEEDLAEGDAVVLEVVAFQDVEEADEALDAFEPVEEGGDDGQADGAEESEGEGAGCGVECY